MGEGFFDLGQIFPNAKLGFGEVGKRESKNKVNYFQHYYELKINDPRYIGGHFWWFFRKDMIPKSKKLWSVFDDIQKF